MRNLSYITLFLLFLLGVSCNQSDMYRQVAKTTDSLVGAVSAVNAELAQTDTARLERSLRVYERYRNFIRGHVKDTISREIADGLKRFYDGGDNLQRFRQNRTDLLARIALVTSQLEKLSADARTKALKPDVLREYLLTEKIAADKLLKASREQLQLMHNNLAQLKQTLPLVEQLIRNNNNGELPVVVKEEPAAL